MVKTGVYYNGKMLGYHKEPEKFLKEIKKKRRKNQLPKDLTVAYYPKTEQIQINTSEGRAMRPVIIVENGKSKFTKDHLKLLKKGELKFSDLVEMGVIEYLDAEEEENCYIALQEHELTTKHTHLEIYPTLILGVNGVVSPYCHHNMSTRIEMTTNMLKQALGMYASNFNLRTDTQAHLMYYPQEALVQTKFSELIGVNRTAAGQNLVIAVMPFYGYNINDAVIVNKASIDRGLFRTVSYRTYVSEERSYPGGQKDRFEKPVTEISGFRGEEAYRYLDNEGIIEPEFDVESSDVLVGKSSPPRFLEEMAEFGMIEEKRRENSCAVRRAESGTIDKVIITESEGGNRLVKIKVRKVMMPEIGDKVASRHGQKGVIGLIVPASEMPFSENGIIPDLCINPHALPGRMTVGFNLETMAGKAGALYGEAVDATPFDAVPEKKLKEILEKHGFKPDGKEIMYDGKTGNKINAEIFTGVNYYQRLKHLVANKIHARGRGPVQILTRQPTEGRTREGGLRFGEMERDCLIGHGTAMLLKERLLEESDKIVQLVCENCGMTAIDDVIRNKKYCMVCGSDKVYPVEVSYAFKLLLDEMKAMGIYPRIKLQSKV